MLRKTYKVPIIFDNFRGNDSHMMLWGQRSFPVLNINLIGQGMEKYPTMGLRDHLVFKDSLQFLASSLETLACNLLSSVKDLFKKLGASVQVNVAADAHLEMPAGNGAFL